MLSRCSTSSLDWPRFKYSVATLLSSEVIDTLFSLAFGSNVSWPPPASPIFLLSVPSLPPLPGPHLLLTLRISPPASLFVPCTLSLINLICSTHWGVIPKVSNLSPTSQLNLQLVQPTHGYPEFDTPNLNPPLFLIALLLSQWCHHPLRCPAENWYSG